VIRKASPPSLPTTQPEQALPWQVRQSASGKNWCLGLQGGLMLGLWIVCAPAISAGKTSKSIQDGYSPEAASWRSHVNGRFRPVTDGQSLREQTFNVNLWGAGRIAAKRFNERHVRRFCF
jgi:hypothetical protein